MVRLDKDKNLSYCNTVEAERNTVGWQALERGLHQEEAASKEEDHRWTERGGSSSVKAGRVTNRP